jgi:hypothetical protein
LATEEPKIIKRKSFEKTITKPPISKVKTTANRSRYKLNKVKKVVKRINGGSLNKVLEKNKIKLGKL